MIRSIKMVQSINSLPPWRRRIVAGVVAIAFLIATGLAYLMFADPNHSDAAYMFQWLVLRKHLPELPPSDYTGPWKFAEFGTNSVTNSMWKNGKRYGKTVCAYGEGRYECDYVDGVEHGREVCLDRSGQKVEETIWKNGARIRFEALWVDNLLSTLQAHKSWRCNEIKMDLNHPDHILIYRDAVKIELFSHNDYDAHVIHLDGQDQYYEIDQSVYEQLAKLPAFTKH